MNSARTSVWGSQLKAREQYRFDENFKRSPELRDSLMKAFNDSSKVDELIKGGAVQALLNDGETDPGRMAKALRLMENVYKQGTDDNGNKVRGMTTKVNGRDIHRYDLSDTQAMKRMLVTARMTRNFGPNTWITGTRENQVIRESFKRQFEDEGLSPSQISDEIDRILNNDQDFMNS